MSADVRVSCLVCSATLSPYSSQDFWQRCEEFGIDFRPVSTTPHAVIDNSELARGTELGVTEKAPARRAVIKTEVQPLLVVLMIPKSAVVSRQYVSSDENFEWEVRHNAEFMPENGSAD